MGESPYRSDEIDALIHWALRDSVAGEEPPPEIWHKIRAGLEQSKVQSHPRRERFLVAQLSWLVQLLVVGIIILVAFGLSLRQGFEPAVNREYVVNDGRTPQPGSEEVVPFSTDDHMLSGYHLFQSARKLTIFDHRLAP
ncbi:MAG TPA: hypothetical protein EYP49_08075 [Anaerolineae bacterium]|nr:hypothetical protein [Anaerolineae bacterium]